MIRELKEEDLNQILLLENDLFKDGWPEKEFLYELNENPFSTLYVMDIDDEIVGYCDLWITYEQAQIANIAVKRSMWKKGYGYLLLQKMQNHAIQAGCENLTLEVRVSNFAAIHLYEKFGFITVAVRKNYYPDGEDAYLMIKPLGGLEYDDVVGN